MTKSVLIILFICIAGYLSEAGSRRTPVHINNGSDTAILNDSLGNGSGLNDPRKAFKDIFIAGAGKSEEHSVQLNPMAISFVQDYMNKHTRQLSNMKDWGRPYFDVMQEILNANGLPGELKYLAVIESNLKSNALSWAGAVGPWQFMPATARKMGLKVGRYVDERTDYYKSTRAAARYLSDLFSIYGDWLLVIAAYNGGAAQVNHAIARSRSRNFWNLQYYLPEESRNHVKKFIATHYIMEGNGGITTVTKEEAQELTLSSSRSSLSLEELNNTSAETITGKYNSVVIARNTALDISSFNRYNPDFDRQIGLNGTFELRLPADKMAVFNSKKYQILGESMSVLLAPVNSTNK